MYDDGWHGGVSSAVRPTNFFLSFLTTARFRPHNLFSSFSSPFVAPIFLASVCITLQVPMATCTLFTGVQQINNFWVSTMIDQETERNCHKSYR